MALKPLSKNPIFALVGDSGAGKTELSVAVLKTWADSAHPLAYVRTFTSRARRPNTPSEDVVYDFTSRKSIMDRKRRGQLIECVEPYPGVVHAVSRGEIRRVLAGPGIGIIALTEQGVHHFKDAGIRVVPIKIETKNRPPKTGKDLARADEDERRARIPVPYWNTVYNNFAPGGRAKALADLQYVMMAFLGGT